MSSQYPPALQFGIPKKIQPFIRVSSTLPLHYEQYRVALSAETTYVEGPFGSYITQEIKDPDWVISWVRCFIKEKVRLHPSASFPMLLMCCMLKGNIPCRLQGHGQLMLIEKEFGIYYLPAQSQNIADLKTGNYEMVCISLSPAFFEGFINRHPSFEAIYQRQQKQARKGMILPVFYMNDPERKVLRKLEECPAQHPARKIFLQERLNELLSLYFKALLPKYLQNNEQLKQLQQACLYIQQHYHTPLTIPALSRLAGMHLNAFEKNFKALTGFSPRDYIESCRMEKAAIMLHQTTKSIKEISFSTGYTCANYFTAVFRKHYNCPPSIYRKKGIKRR